MCGIAGSIDLGNNRIDKKIIPSLIESIRHRGPNFENYWLNNNLVKVKTNKEIILSAGTIGSPHILQASGIGPGELLKNNNSIFKINISTL